jgi:2,4-dienoyl-CoA reductase-like NADH-dependent reductase (Old Yellow Enzyme family)
MPGLYESTSIKTMPLANRFVRSATWEGLANDDGSPSPKLIDTSVELVRGGVGLIITGHAYVSPEGQAGRWQLGVHSDESIPGLMQMTGAVHRAGGRIALQLAHAGSRAPLRVTGLEPVGPSVAQTGSGPVGREMTKQDIQAVTSAFTEATVRAQEAGFDGVQIHAAHGYLLSQFLSPFYNKRQDNYGGSITNRARLNVEILKSIRNAVGPDYPVFIKVNSEDFLPQGLSVEEMIGTALMLQEAGIDAIEMSGGTFLSGAFTPSRKKKAGPGEPEAYYETAAKEYKKRVEAPLMLVGGIRTLETAERLVAERLADYIALSRPLIREPALVNRWKSGDRGPARCVSDNGCFQPGFEGKGVFCVVEARQRRREEAGDNKRHGGDLG